MYKKIYRHQFPTALSRAKIRPPGNITHCILHNDPAQGHVLAQNYRSLDIPRPQTELRNGARTCQTLAEVRQAISTAPPDLLWLHFTGVVIYVEELIDFATQFLSSPTAWITCVFDRCSNSHAAMDAIRSCTIPNRHKFLAIEFWGKTSQEPFLRNGLNLFEESLLHPLPVLLSVVHQHNQANLPHRTGFSLPGNVHIRATPLGRVNWAYSIASDAVAFNSHPVYTMRFVYRACPPISFIFRDALFLRRLLNDPMVNPGGNYCLDMIPRPAQVGNDDKFWALADSTAQYYLQRTPQNPGPQFEVDPCHFLNDFFTAVEEYSTTWHTRPLREVRQQLTYIMPVFMHAMMTADYRVAALGILYKAVQLDTHTALAAINVGLTSYVSRLGKAPSLATSRLAVKISEYLTSIFPSQPQSPSAT